MEKAEILIEWGMSSIENSGSIQFQKRDSIGKNTKHTCNEIPLLLCLENMYVSQSSLSNPKNLHK